MKLSTLAAVVWAFPLGLAGGPAHEVVQPSGQASTTVKPTSAKSVTVTRATSTPTSVASANFVHSHFQKLPKPANTGDVKTPLDQIGTQSGMLWAVSLAVGNPSQNITVAIDTGSSDLWFPDVTSSVCSSPYPVDFCNAGEKDEPYYFGGIDPTKASNITLFQKIPFAAAYGDGTEISGYYAKDVVFVGGVEVQNTSFGIVNKGTSPGVPLYGIWGVGFEAGWTSLATTGTTLPSMLHRMKNATIIDCQMYSVYSNGFGTTGGEITFGGVDTAKFDGPLHILDMVSPTGGNITEFFVPLTSFVMKAGTEQKVFNVSAPVLLDTGSASTTLPSSIEQDFYSLLGMSSLEDNLCGLPIDELSFVFEFANDPNATIVVNGPDVIKPRTFNGTAQTDQNGNPYCTSPIGFGNDTSVLGATFLEAAYVAFDLENFQIGIAQGKRNVTETSIVSCMGTAIPSGATVSPTASFTLASAAPTGAPSIPTDTGMNGTTFTLSSANPRLTGVTTGGSPGNTAAIGAAGSVVREGMRESIIVAVVVMALMAVGGAAVVL